MAYAMELQPGDPIPEGVHTTFLGVEGESAETTTPEDTWSASDLELQDGLHVYEIPEMGYVKAEGRFGRERFHLVQTGSHLVRPIVTKSYVERVNARSVESGGSSLIISQAELDESMERWRVEDAAKVRPTLIRKALGFLGLLKENPEYRFPD
jgi:hypothetical protein